MAVYTNDLRLSPVIIDGEQMFGFAEGDDGVIVVTWDDSQAGSVTLSGDGTSDCHNDKPKTHATIAIRVCAVNADIVSKLYKKVKENSKFSMSVGRWNGVEAFPVIKSSSARIKHFPEESIGQAGGVLEFNFECLGCN